MLPVSDGEETRVPAVQVIVTLPVALAGTDVAATITAISARANLPNQAKDPFPPFVYLCAKKDEGRY